MNMPRNIVYLHSHDTGRWIEPYGHRVATPNLMQLAQRGTLFRKAFCVGPTCSPSRAALLTGQYPHNAGMYGLAHRGHRLTHPQHHLNHTFKKAGMKTILAGIQHVAANDLVHELGYDEILPVASMRSADVADAAIDRIGNINSTQPFFMSIGMFDTHRTSGGGFGYEADRQVIDYTLPAAPLCDNPQTRLDMARFNCSAMAMDDAIGRVLRALDENKLTDNTLIIYTTDHGPAFPRMKSNLTDMGMGVSLIMAGPDGFNEGKVFDSMVSHLDLFPTFCDFLEIDKPDWLVGQSLYPLIKGEVDELHETIYAQVNYHGACDPLRCLRTDRYKFIKRFEDRNTPTLRNCDPGPTRDYWITQGWAKQQDSNVQLYDLLFDPYETNNLAQQPEHIHRVEQFETQLHDWMKQHDDPLLAGDLPQPENCPPDPFDYLVKVPIQLS